ncbi:hypothetical protein MPB2EB_0770 [Mycoavidus sp. B2-EB]|nr:hypothetical protein MPB2EB_0770 [Mycoavidus sp. B2-EB]
MPVMAEASIILSKLLAAVMAASGHKFDCISPVYFG